MKKRFCMILLFALALLSFQGFLNISPVRRAEAAAPKLSKTKKTLYVGDSFKLKLKNATGTVKYKSTNKKIVTVAKDGTVTAVAPGKAKIKVTDNGITYKCKITVKKAKAAVKDPTGSSGPSGDIPAYLSITDEEVCDAIMALQSEYPEGMPWTNANTYTWGREVASGLGYSSFGGAGCQAFAMLASDAAFGNAPAYRFDDPAHIRPGDILRINSDTHSVVVLKVDGDKITIAEGNFNSSIHWGRVIDINNCDFVYGYTRRPVG
ncbi:MAG: Ig-like domain-containing protein [Lachnospiraceae bacterium]|nr:Ig-like domain-containing protein [Lachnospiraceae bacterium]